MKRFGFTAVAVVVAVGCLLVVVAAGRGPTLATAAYAAGTPLVQSRTVDWAQPVQPDKVWSIRFNSPVDVLTVTSGRVLLLDSAGNRLATQIKVLPDGLRLTVKPVKALPPGDYRLQLLAGIQDSAGKPVQEPLQINFSVTDSSIAESLADEAGSAGTATLGQFAQGMMSNAPVDLAVTSGDLALPSVVTPGGFVNVRVLVHNHSPGTGLAGGSVVRFLLDGRVIDEVPFYLAAGDADQTVRANFYLPAGPYKLLQGQERATVHVTAVVDPENRTPETDEGNNTASGQFQVRPDGDIAIEDTAPPMTVDASGLSVWSAKDDAHNDAIQAALPSETLHLKAVIACPGNDDHEDINVKFLVDGVVVLDDNRRVARPSSGFIQVTDEYVVPYNETGPLDFKVLLSNGSTASIKVPVLRWDTEVRPGDLSWSTTDVAVPGQHLYLHAVIKNTSSLTGGADAQIACRVLVNGQPFYEHSYRAMYDELNVTVPAYDVPADQAGPVIFTVVTDPYDQLAESDETNNVATIEVPLVNNYSATPGLWVGSDDLTYIARPIVPGSHVLLSAAIHNRSSQVPPKNVRVQFKINGAIVGDVTRDRAFFGPLQAQLVTFTWITPLDLVGAPTFQVVIDPENVISEGAEENNEASLELQVAKPDLEPAPPWLSWTPPSPIAGESVTLRAVVRNNGSAPVTNAQVRFLVDGQPVGDATIPTISAAGGGVATLNWAIPPGAKLESLPWSNLVGTPGHIPLPAGLTHDFAVGVVVDPEQRVAESNEDNNTADPVTMTVSIPNEKKAVYLHVTDLVGPVPVATAVLQAANGASAETLTADDGWCCFTGVAEGAYTLSVSKEGYIAQTLSGEAGGQSTVYTKWLVLEVDGNVTILTQNDRDHDLLSDELELLYGTNPDNPDTDGDGVIDGKDLSPLIDPVEPVFTYLQQPGMVRLEQPIAAYGLDGWCEVWDMDWSWSSMSDKLVYSKTYQEKGTRKSTMSPENFRKAVDMLYESSGLRSWAIKDVTPLEIGYGDEELGADGKAEDSWIYPADHFHRTEYRFSYDYLTDYQVVSLKNETEMLYPSDESFFSYLLIPLQHVTGLTHSYSLQFLQAGLADQISFSGEGTYRQLGLQYSFYPSNQFTDDNLKPLSQGIVLVDTDGSDLFSCSITLPAELATATSSYLKITPVWVTKTGGPDPSVAPAALAWNLTGLVRDVVYSQDSAGNSVVGSYHAASVAELGLPVRSLAEFRSLESNPAAKVRTEWAGFVTANPTAPAGEQITAVDSEIKILSLVGKGIGGAGSGIEALVEKVVKGTNKVEKISQLPDTHWIKGAQYQSVLAGFAAAGGAVTMFSNGREAYLAYQEGDTIACTYYSAKGVVAAGETVHSLAKISKHVVAYSGKTGRFAMLASDKVAVGLAVAIGVVEIGYNAARWQETKDPIQKSAYFEKTLAAGVDTVLGVVGAVYGPQMLAFQVTWMVGNEFVFRVLGGDAIAYEVAKTPATAIVFIAAYWGEDVPSQLAEAAYKSMKDDLMVKLKAIIEFGKLPFIPVFIDPLL